MDRNKMRTFLEIIYNCPFILLIVFTSLAFVTFFDVLGAGQIGVAGEKKIKTIHK